MDTHLIWIAVALCGLVLTLIAALGLVKLVVYGLALWRAVRTPPHRDAGDYRLTQGREVRSEEQHRPD
ncbi:hypothetical protein [Kallotenue papyrolyticum]|uniref:hypothetical protein n=1 Tax=Kallotenue papyrolyticum TaxID=1325125 RepID=UPI000478588E|nr:hypothetical protein [Kallotenue papyrolyticum]